MEQVEKVEQVEHEAPPPPRIEPTGGLAPYQSVRRVLAGQITEVVEAGCFVREANGDAILRMYAPGMTARYTPEVGDYWLVYSDGYQAICPMQSFEEGYYPAEAPKV